MSTFHLQNFGCRANQAEGAALARGLEARGWRGAGEAAGAEFVILNTCTVTSTADAEARRAIGRIHRDHPGAKIVVTGCYAQRARAELVHLPGVARVVERERQAVLAEDLAPMAGPGRAEQPPPAPAARPTRPTVKVQDGCDRRCAFCVVPFVRGASRSRALGSVLHEIEAHVAAGTREVVISGVNLGQWGRDLDRGLHLGVLLRAVLEQTTLARLRLSSVEPMDWTGELAEMMAGEPRLARHLHLPLQSGSDAVLRRMRRRYRARDYGAQVERLHRLVPGVAIGADVIVGFPGESEAEFEQTRALVAALPLAYLHVFPYSPRPGTEAADRLRQPGWMAVGDRVAAGRGHELRQLGEGKRAAFCHAQVGSRLSVLTLRQTPGQRPWALSDNYLRVALPSPQPSNQLLEVSLTAAGGDHVEAQLLSPAMP